MTVNSHVDRETRAAFSCMPGFYRASSKAGNAWGDARYDESRPCSTTPRDARRRLAQCLSTDLYGYFVGSLLRVGDFPATGRCGSRYGFIDRDDVGDRFLGRTHLALAVRRSDISELDDGKRRG